MDGKGEGEAWRGGREAGDGGGAAGAPWREANFGRWRNRK